LQPDENYDLKHYNEADLQMLIKNRQLLKVCDAYAMDLFTLGTAYSRALDQVAYVPRRLLWSSFLGSILNKGLA
jgi:hypothetical protein